MRRVIFSLFVVCGLLAQAKAVTVEVKDVPAGTSATDAGTFQLFQATFKTEMCSIEYPQWDAVRLFVVRMDKPNQPDGKPVIQVWVVNKYTNDTEYRVYRTTIGDQQTLEAAKEAVAAAKDRMLWHPPKRFPTTGPTAPRRSTTSLAKN